VGSNEKRYITKIGKIVIEQEEGLVARDGSDQYEEIVLSDSELMEDGYFDFTDEDGHFDFTDRVRDVYESVSKTTPKRSPFFSQLGLN
jgi:hypothetical protein